LFGRGLDIRSLDERSDARDVNDLRVLEGLLGARDENRARVFCHGFSLGIRREEHRISDIKGMQRGAM
jgi:hypothetical protein